VELASSGRPNDIMATAASYDSTLRYGAQTPFNDQLTFHWEAAGESGELLIWNTESPLQTASTS
jgi:hypothetical protein